jgi:hypothetical protein
MLASPEPLTVRKMILKNTDASILSNWCDGYSILGNLVIFNAGGLSVGQINDWRLNTFFILISDACRLFYCHHNNYESEQFAKF